MSNNVESADDNSGFDVNEFAEELSAAPTNFAVGEEVLFENDRVRVWWSTIDPGKRVQFHNHTIDYFWVCVRASRAYQRFEDGTARFIDPVPGQVSFQTYGPGENLVHDLENVGDGSLEIVTVELLDQVSASS